jgi:hypothetical protein
MFTNRHRLFLGRPNFYKNEGVFPRNINTIKQIHFALVTFHPPTTPFIHHPFHNLPIHSNSRILTKLQMSHKDLVFKHGDDYGIWKLRAIGHLATKDLFDVDLEIDGWVKKNSSILKECAQDEVIEKYEESQEKGLLIFYSLLDTPVIKKLGKVTTAQEAFTKLGEIYEKQGGVEVIVLIHKLVNLKMKGNDVEGYLSEFDGVMRDIEKREYNMVEVERAMFMLCGIPEEWSFLRSQVFL